MPDEPRSPTFYHNFVAMHVSAVELVAGRVSKHVSAHAPLASVRVAGLDSQRACDFIFGGRGSTPKELPAVYLRAGPTGP